MKKANKMIRIQLVHEGRVVKQVSSRVHEGIVLEQIKRYNEPYDTIAILEGDLSEGAKDMFKHVAKKIIPAAMAAGIALGGAGAPTDAHAQSYGNVGAPGINRDFPGLDQSIGQHLGDIFAPNYRERVRQREYERQTQQQEWNARQNEIRNARIQAARDQGRAQAGLPPAGSTNTAGAKVYDQSRVSQDGNFYIIYDMDNRVTRVPVKGTEFMSGDSQRLPHYITGSGSVFYVRHPHNNGLGESLEEGVGTIGTTPTIPSSGTGPTNTKFNPTGQTTNVKFNNKGQLSLDNDDEDATTKPGQLSPEAIKQLQDAGVEIEETALAEDAGLSAILDQYASSYAKFKEGDDLSDDPEFFQALFDYYSDNGEMPYGTQKARDGDPYQWISDRLDMESGIDPVAEGAEFGAYYSEQLAQKVFDQNPNLDTSGRADAYFDVAWPIMAADLGKKRAQYEINSEDFPMDTVSAYSHLQKQQQGVAEGSAHGYNVVRYYEKTSDRKNLTNWLCKEAGLEKNAPVYFDDADLVYGDKTIVPNALVNPKLKFNDLLTALVQATGGQGKQNVDGVYRSQGVAEVQINELSPELLKKARDRAGEKWADADDRKDKKASAKYNAQDDKFNSALRKKQKDIDEGVAEGGDSFQSQFDKKNAKVMKPANPVQFVKREINNNCERDGCAPGELNRNILAGIAQQSGLALRDVLRIRNMMDPVMQQGMAEGEDDADEATAADQGAADKNIIMQIRKASDYETPMTLELADGNTAKIDARVAKIILAQFDRLKPVSKELMQQTLNTREGFTELLNYFNEREVAEANDINTIREHMNIVAEAQVRAKALIKSIYGKI